jgi:hypothetical protein
MPLFEIHPTPQAFRVIQGEKKVDMLNRLVTSRRFWLAIVAVFVTGLSTAFPQIPATLVQAAQVFALALIAAFTIDDTANAFANRP